MAKRSLLMIGAHPDDETTLAPLLVKYARGGHDVHLVSITSGQKGVRPHYGLAAGDALGDIRAEELRCSARTLGVHEPWLLGFQDQGIAPLEAFWEAMGRIREVVNETRPDVIVTFGPDGITGHVDHRVASELATVVFQQRGLLNCDPKKLYYLAFPESIYGTDANPLARKRDFLLVSEPFVTTVVDCSDTVDAGLKSIDCHKSQFRPERMEQLKALYRSLMGGKVFLRLALTTLPWPREREHCVLAGLD